MPNEGVKHNPKVEIFFSQFWGVLWWLPFACNFDQFNRIRVSLDGATAAPKLRFDFLSLDAFAGFFLNEI